MPRAGPYLKRALAGCQNTVTAGADRPVNEATANVGRRELGAVPALSP
ncbi:MAG: hypothetical protein SGJ11_13625 [Phycisphaerae bacterium]|nr:hypothetical protein [Phycisphaerae bacterium]